MISEILSKIGQIKWILAKIGQIKWNWTRSVKFEKVRIDFKVTLLVCCHPKILLPWQCDVMTSLYYNILKKV